MKLNLTLSSAAQTVIRRVGGMGAQFAPAIARGLDGGLEYALGKVAASRFTGRGPFPVGEHRLGVVSSRLRTSLRRSKATVNGGIVRASVGSNVTYFSPHEFGFSGTVSVRAHARNKTTGRGKKKQTNSVSVRAHTRAVNVPERAPLRTGIKEQAPAIALYISRAIVRAYKEGGIR